MSTSAVGQVENGKMMEVLPSRSMLGWEIAASLTGA